MQISRDLIFANGTLKNPQAAITLLLASVFAISLLAIPNANAQITQKTYPFIDATPNPVGVGEQVLIRFGITQQLGSVQYGWQNLTVTIVKPDGSTETLGPYATDSTGGTAIIYVPEQTGTYKLTANFPEQVNPYTYYDYERGAMFLAGTIMKASTSETIELVVQEESTATYPGHPLPTEYWSRPIDSQLREWASIAGNWMTRPDNSLADNNDAPETAHVLWAKQLTTGGLTGDYWGTSHIPAGSETGDAYEGKWQNSVVLNGILYYNIGDAQTPQTGIVAVDLHTGEQLWFRNATTLSFGQILYFDSFNYDGVYTYLWSVSGTTYNAYDPFNGEWVFSFTNVPSGTRVFGPYGEILIYQIDYANCWMALWNSTAAGQSQLTSAGDFGSWGRFVSGKIFDASVPQAYSWNVSIPTGLTASTSFFTPILKVYSDRVVTVFFNQTQVRVWALKTEGLTKTSTSTYLLFDKTWAAPAEWLEGSNTLHYVGASNEVEDGVIAVWSKELRKHYGFSVETGDYLWETESEHFLDSYGWGNAEHTWYFAYGKLYSVGVGGIVYCYDLKTGDTLWTYAMSDEYGEPVTGNNWWGWITLISDGKVYVTTVEHSAEQPLPRGGPYICLDAETGDVIWRVNGMFRGTRWGGNSVIGDSIIATMDTYDQRIYAIGKGPTAVTVAAPDTEVALGKAVLVKGTVTDISPGTQDTAIKLRFPNGVPAVADESMSEWMLYVYKQFEKPADVKGVEVIIEVLDPNGNYYEVARTTSDSNGFFSATFTPPVPGKYTVIAKFAGSKAYYGSSAETALIVGEAPAATAEATPAPQAPVETYFAISTVAIIAAIAIVGILILRKR
ncbi:MAG: PQQ-binding-like beta-propeller repeat protein [Candidatus Bathyarchaeia archaeon]